MSGFGEWLRDTQLNLTEIIALRTTVAELGGSWPTTAIRQEDYVTSIASGIQDTQRRTEAIQMIYKVWPLYEPMGAPVPRQPRRASLVITPNAFIIAVVAVLILILIILAIGGLKLTELAKIEVARGLLTFLFGVTTVGIALIVVIAVFLGGDARAPNELGERFQRGKDILTVLIGVFGAILGFYFGSEKNSPANPPRVEESGGAGVSSSVPVIPMPQGAPPATSARPAQEQAPPATSTELPR